MTLRSFCTIADVFVYPGGGILKILQPALSCAVRGKGAFEKPQLNFCALRSTFSLCSCCNTCCCSLSCGSERAVSFRIIASQL